KTFFRLLKLAEALELAANAQLEQLSGSDVDLMAPEATAAMARAAALIEAVQRESDAEFHRGGPEDHLDSDHFLDVLRQFTVHWRAGDLPPSRAQDPQFLKRDLLLGIDYPDYPGHIRRVFTMLLRSERDELERLFDPMRERERKGIPDRELVSNWVGTTGLVEANLEQLAAARERHPLTRLAAIADAEITSLMAVHPIAAPPIRAVISNGR